VRKFSPLVRKHLTDFGSYVSECLPKFVQRVQLTAGDELEILIAPQGVVPVLTFLKDHHNAQFTNITDLTAMDVPSRKYRFEVSHSSFPRLDICA
jgi:NADH dehydrogenase (ubiquinone) Fe-S protein 3